MNTKAILEGALRAALLRTTSRRKLEKVGEWVHEVVEGLQAGHDGQGMGMCVSYAYLMALCANVAQIEFGQQALVLLPVMGAVKIAGRDEVSLIELIHDERLDGPRSIHGWASTVEGGRPLIVDASARHFAKWMQQTTDSKTTPDVTGTRNAKTVIGEMLYLARTGALYEVLPERTMRLWSDIDTDDYWQTLGEYALHKIYKANAHESQRVVHTFRDLVGKYANGTANGRAREA